MAGESPDKVERKESSGETTDDGAAVASTDGKESGRKRERKPGTGPDATGSGSTEAPGEAREEAGEGTSQAPSESPAGNVGDTEAEAADGAGASDAEAGSDGGSDAGEARNGSEGAGRGDERLKAAVAAWVAGTDDEPDEAAQSDEGAGGADGAQDVKDGSGKSAAGEQNSSQIPAGALPVRPKSEGEAPEPADGPPEADDEVDQPTAMFRTVRPGSDDSSAATDSEEAARRAERMTAAFFGSAKPTGTEAAGQGGGQDADEDADEDAGEDKGEGEGTAGEAEPEPEPEPEDERTAGEAETEPEPEQDESGDEQAEHTDQAGQAEADAGRVDEPTTAFRAPPEPEAPAKGSAGKRDSGRVDQPTTAFRTVEPSDRGGAAKAGEAQQAPETDEKSADAKPAKPGEQAKPVDPRVPAGAGKADAEIEADDAETDADDSAETDAQPAAGDAESDSKPETAEPDSGPEEPDSGPEKPEPEPESEPDSGSEEPESESERTSQFVPLRSADLPPRPTRAPGAVVPPMPDGRPTAGELPPEEPPQLSEAERTRQEVRPDQAPLDLLAQLTNTPPPPETPLRIAARRVKIWTPLVVLLSILFAIAQAVRPLPDPELALSAAPTFSFQGPKPSVPWPSEGQAALDVDGLGSFGSSGKQKPVPIASVAKVMTAYVILRDHPVKKGSDGAKIRVDKKAEKEAGLSAQNESTVEVKKGDTLSEREAVEAVMIASANNVARLLARWDAGSEKAFAKKMNAAAEDLGMKDTKYTDPSGLTSSTVSTASDQVKLGKKAMSIDLFHDTVRLPAYTDTKGDKHGNWNKLVPLDGVVGIKTGTTTKAGGNLLFAAEKKVGGTEQLIIGAVLGQYEPSILDTVLAESKKLIDTAQDALRAQKVVQKGEVVGYVDDQLGGRTPVVASRDVSAVGWSGLKVKLGLTDGGKVLPHAGKAGDRAGMLTVGDGPGQVRVPVKLKEDMTEPGFGAKLTRIL